LLTLSPYAFFRGLKQPTSSGCRRCDKCAGIHRLIIF
jgi:hypothetical protein